MAGGAASRAALVAAAEAKREVTEAEKPSAPAASAALASLVPVLACAAKSKLTASIMRPPLAASPALASRAGGGLARLRDSWGGWGG